MNNLNWTYIIIGIGVIVLLILLYKYMYGTDEKYIEEDTDSQTMADKLEYYNEITNFITVILPAFPQYIGSQIIVKTPNNTYFRKYEDVNDNNFIFNLHDENMVEHVIIRTVEGDDMIYNYPEVNKPIRIETKMEKLEREIKELQTKISSYN